MGSNKMAWLFLLVLGLCILPACSDNQQAVPQAGNAGGADNSAKASKASEAEIADIVNAVVAKDAAKVGRMLKANPKLILVKSDNGWPLLMIAAENGDKPMVELLLNSGADVNDKNFSDEAALMYAALKGHKEIVELLLAKNADVNAKSTVGATALDGATSAHHQDIADLLKQHGAK